MTTVLPGFVLGSSTAQRLADGWLGTSFIPERSDALLEPIRRGAARANRSLSDIEI